MIFAHFHFSRMNSGFGWISILDDLFVLQSFASLILTVLIQLPSTKLIHITRRKKISPKPLEPPHTSILLNG